jgi:hypothetical protein
MLQCEPDEEHEVMLHEDNNCAVVGVASVVDAVHGGCGMQNDNKAAAPINFDPTSCLVGDSVLQARKEQVTT